MNLISDETRENLSELNRLSNKISTFKIMFETKKIDATISQINKFFPISWLKNNSEIKDKNLITNKVIDSKTKLKRKLSNEPKTYTMNNPFSSHEIDKKSFYEKLKDNVALLFKKFLTKK